MYLPFQMPRKEGQMHTCLFHPTGNCLFHQVKLFFFPYLEIGRERLSLSQSRPLPADLRLENHKMKPYLIIHLTQTILLPKGKKKKLKQFLPKKYTKYCRGSSPLFIFDRPNSVTKVNSSGSATLHSCHLSAELPCPISST